MMRGKRKRVACHNFGSNSDPASPKELKVFAILRSAFSASRLLQPSKCLQGGRSKLRYLGILVEKETALGTNFAKIFDYFGKGKVRESDYHVQKQCNAIRTLYQ